MAGIRIFGLGSGLDIDQIVNDLMKVERMRRVDKLEKNKQTVQWKQELFQEVNRDIANFIIDIKKELGLASSTATGLLINKTTDSFTWVKKASSSNEDIATASATTAALNGSYKVNIIQLAEGVSKTSTEAITTGKSGTLKEQFGDVFGEDGILRFTIRTHKTGEEGKTFEFDTNTKTINDIVKEINNSDIGIAVSYDKGLDRFFINTKDTGKSSFFIIEADEDNFLSDANGSGDNLLKLKIETGKENHGKDLIFNFGDAEGLSKPSNTFSINGINITAKSTGEFNINVETNVDSIYQKIESFVNKYNELIEKLNGKLTEKVYRSYEPLTEEEKEKLSEDQIKKWEDLAKSGLLRNDSILSNMLQELRQGLYDKVDGLIGINHLTQIGIETGDYTSKGKLVIDESKLKAAILENPDAIIDLFFKEPSSELNVDDDKLTKEEVKEKYRQSGLVNRVFNSMINAMKAIIDRAGPGNDSQLLRNVKSNILIDFVTGKNLKKGSISILDENIMEIEKNILNQEYILAMMEEKYYKQYSAMETALSSMYQQSNWLSAQLSGFLR